MKGQPILNDSSGIFLTAAILLANMDFSGLMDYALRGIIGGAIWMVFKVATDYLSAKMKKEKGKNETVD